jgi:hypothetical protein
MHRSHHDFSNHRFQSSKLSKTVGKRKRAARASITFGRGDLWSNERTRPNRKSQAAKLKRKIISIDCSEQRAMMLAVQKNHVLGNSAVRPLQYITRY